MTFDIARMVENLSDLSTSPYLSNFPRFSRDDEAPSSAIVKEELIEIYAPAGKLGVVLEDSVADDGPPLVHNLRDASVLKNALLAGDRIIALDDDDVRNMSASKLSKMISQKRENETRKLSIIRTIPATGVAAEC